METRTIDMLFLELSQVTNATTQKELALQTFVEDYPYKVADWLATQEFPDDDGSDTYKRAYNNALRDAAKRLRDGKGP